MTHTERLAGPVSSVTAPQIVWHDLECGGYRADLALWRELASAHGDPVLDIGAGTGRVALPLAAAGHSITALDSDPDLVGELARRAEGLPVKTVLADARCFELDRQFRLCIVPMQTIQLLGGAAERGNFLRCTRRHVCAGGVVAIAIAETLQLYEVAGDGLAPVSDRCVIDGIGYFSQPIAVREDREGFVLERLRQIRAPGAPATEEHDAIRLDRLDAAELEREASSAGLRPADRQIIPETRDHVGSTVVILRA